MSATVAIGPLVLQLSMLVVLAAVAAGWWTGERFGARRGVPTEAALYLLLASALVAARLAFVLEYRDAYLEAPWSVLDIRDGGWRPIAGLLGAAAATAILTARRRNLAMPLLAALAGAGMVWWAGSLVLALVGPTETSVPPLTLPSLAGQPVPLELFKGKPLVMNLWATWCPPCRRELPILQQGQQRHPDVNFVFLDQAEHAARVNAFLAANHLELRNVLVDQRGEVAAQLGHGALPTTLFFDAQGRLVDTRVGELSSATLAERLQALAPSPR